MSWYPTYRFLGASLLLGLLVACFSGVAPSAGESAESKVVAAESLREPAEFRGIQDKTLRSESLFTEAARVLQSPRCMNCHPVSRFPTQGDDMHPHVPLIHAGASGHGVAGLECSACHQKDNVNTLSFPIASIPGNSHWALAPESMAWQGLSIGQICEQLKNPRRNGSRTLAQIHKHVKEDSLVGWAWNPGAGRKPAPGTQQTFAELVEAWIETGAACPRG